MLKLCTLKPVQCAEEKPKCRRRPAKHYPSMFDSMRNILEGRGGRRSCAEVVLVPIVVQEDKCADSSDDEAEEDDAEGDDGDDGEDSRAAKCGARREEAAARRIQAEKACRRGDREQLAERLQECAEVKLAERTQAKRRQEREQAERRQAGKKAARRECEKKAACRQAEKKAACRQAEKKAVKRAVVRSGAPLPPPGYAPGRSSLRMAGEDDGTSFSGVLTVDLDDADLTADGSVTDSASGVDVSLSTSDSDSSVTIVTLDAPVGTVFKVCQVTSFSDPSTDVADSELPSVRVLAVNRTSGDANLGSSIEIEVSGDIVAFQASIVITADAEGDAAPENATDPTTDGPTAPAETPARKRNTRRN
jgi:hypothetical protein